MNRYKVTMTVRTQDAPISTYCDTEREAAQAEYVMERTWRHIIKSIETVPVTEAETALYYS